MARVAFLFAVVDVVVFAATTVLRRPGESLVWADGWVYSGITVSAAVVCTLRALRGSRDRLSLPRSGREWAWLAIAGGLTATACGDAACAIWVTGDPATPYPSVADWFWIGYFLPMFIGLVLLLRGSVARFLVSTWLDGIVAGLGAAALAYTLVFDRLLLLSGGDAATVIVNLS